MSDFALSVQYQAHSDIADHGQQTKCPPMVTSNYFITLKNQ
jgi:hypothetical protein